MQGQKELHPAFMHNYYLFRKKVFKIFGGAFQCSTAILAVFFNHGLEARATNSMSFSAPEVPIDRWLIISAGILLAAIEGRQN